MKFSPRDENFGTLESLSSETWRVNDHRCDSSGLIADLKFAIQPMETLLKFGHHDLGLALRQMSGVVFVGSFHFVLVSLLLGSVHDDCSLSHWRRRSWQVSLISSRYSLYLLTYLQFERLTH